MAFVVKPVEVMCDRYASHVLRSLLCLCQGVSSDSEFLAARSSSVFIKQLNAKDSAEVVSRTRSRFAINYSSHVWLQGGVF
ncbi:Pumilio homolog 23-like protein [Drosera capensis]